MIKDFTHNKIYIGLSPIVNNLEYKEIKEAKYWI